MPEVTRKDVIVTYEEGTGNHGFSFSPGNKVVLERSAEGTNNYAVIFTLEGPEGIAWQSPFVLWTDGPPPTMPESGLLTLEENQRAIGVHNDNATGPQVKYGCHLLIVVGGNPIESPDPEIVLDPPP